MKLMRLALFFASLVLLVQSGWAVTVVNPTACSPYKGLVKLNELRIGNSGKSSTSNQIELYNSGNVAASVWQGWQLVVYSKGTGSTISKRGGYFLSSGFTANGQFIYNASKSIYMRNRSGRSFDVALVDQSGYLIDYVAVETKLQTPPACFGASSVVNATASSNTSGDIPRLPDGGTWPANVTNTSSHTIGRTNVCSAGGSDLSVSHSVDESNPIANDTQVTYTVSVLNKSCTNSVAGIALTDTGISTTNFSGLSYSPGTGSTAQGATALTWTIGTLAAGASATLSVSGTPKVLGTLTTTAAISAPASGLINTTDDSVPVSLNVRAFNYVGFEIASATLTEGIDSGYSVSIVSSTTASRSITVNYTVSGTAGAGDSNLPTSGSVVIDPNDPETPTQATIDFNITNDAVSEPAKSITLTITSVTSTDTSVRLDSATQSMAITLLDDDPATPIGEWHLEETSWSGAASEVKDSSGNNRHGNTIGSPLPAPAIASPALAGNPGTCGYGNFPGPTANGGAINLSGLPVSTVAGAKTSVAFWMYWNGANSVMPIGWNTHDLWLVSGVFGFNTGNSDVFGIASTGLANRWAHVVAVFTNGNVAANALYIDGVRQTLTQRLSTPNNTTAVVQSTLRIGGWQRDSGYRFAGRIDEVKVFNAEVNPTQVTALYNETHTCAVFSTGPAALNAVDVGANAVSGQINTKTAGTAFNLDIYALNAARTAQDSAASGAVLVDLLANTATGVALDASNCPTTAASLALGTVTLAAGKATASMGVVADSWRDVRVRLRYPATGTATLTACSADNFAVKPAALSAIASHADWQTAGTTATLANTGATGGVVHKAGRPFSLRVTGYNFSSAITGNYDGSPTASTACVLPASGCVADTLNTGSFSASGGTATSSTASYGEVGAISATFTDTGYASVDSGDTAASCAGYWVCASPINIGRFVPDHFDIAANTPAFTPACGSFTYLGQPFGFGAGLGASPAWTVTARNNAGSTTRNYTGSLFKIAAGTVTGQAWSAASGTVAAVGALPAPSVSDSGNGVGSLAFSVGAVASGGGLALTRTATAPFNVSLTLAASVADSEGVAYAGNPYQQAGIGFDDGNAATANDAQMRFGRLRLSNAVGSELLSLPVSLTAQYWNGQGFVTSADDNCTPLTAPGLTFYAQSADNHLASGETTASFNATLSSGGGNLRLSAPGSGNFGYLDLTISAPDWLKYNWDGVDQGGDGNLFDDNARSRAAFGKRKGSDKVIIRQEIY